MKRLLLLLLLAVLLVAPASAWLAGFQYEKDMGITSTYPITLTSYQVKVVFYNTTGVSSGQNCYLNGSITQPTTWNDLRVTTTTDAICDIWIQEFNETAAVVWVEVPYIYTGTTRLRVYTGKPLATAVSDGDATFRFWGTFQVVPLNVDKWVGTGNYTVYTDASNNTVADINRNATSGVSTINTLNSFSYSIGYEQVIRANMVRYPTNSIGMYESANVYIYFGGSKEINNTFITETRTAPGSNSQVTDIGGTYTGWHTFKIKRDQAGGSVLFTIDNVAVANHTSKIPLGSMPMSFRSEAIGGNVLIDYAFVKKYVFPEPAITFWGAPTVEGNPNTQFEANPRFGPVGTTVYFYDLTTGVHDSWLWDVTGDGVTDFTTQNCNYTYSTPGLYNVSLSTSNVNGTDVQFSEDYILISSNVTPIGPTTTQGRVPVIIVAVMMVGCITLAIFSLAFNESLYASIFAAIIASILSFLVGVDLLMVGVTELSAGVTLTYTPQPEGYFFIMLGIMIAVLTLAIIVDGVLKTKEREGL